MERGGGRKGKREKKRRARGREKGKKLTFSVNNVHNASSLPEKGLQLSSI